MKNLDQFDMQRILTMLPKDVVALLKSNSQIYLGGGYIRGTIASEQLNDIDLFGHSKPQLRTACSDLAIGRKLKGERCRSHHTNNAETVLTDNRMPIQFIHRWVFEDVDSCVNSFDFTVCQAAIHFKDDKWVGRCADTFYVDLAAKRLVYTSPARDEDAGGSMLRVIKYVKRGYHIPPQSLGAVVARLCSVFTNPAKNGSYASEHEIQEMLVNEPWRMQLVTNALREVDPLTVVDGLDVRDDHAPIHGLG